MLRLGIHPHGCGVDEQIDLSFDLVQTADADVCQMQLFFQLTHQQLPGGKVFFSCGDGDITARQSCFKRKGACDASAAEDDGLSFQGDAAVGKGGQKAVRVCDEAFCRAVSVVNGVDGPVESGFLVDLVKEGNNPLLVGNRNVVTRQGGQRFHAVFQILGRNIDDGILSAAAAEREKALMDKRRHSVSDGVTDDSKCSF